MKKILYILLSIPVLALSQSTDQNWVKVITYKDSTKTSISLPTISQAITQVNYYDGLGRPIQQVAHGQSNSGKDIVTHMEYDAFGRVEKEFLPYVNQSASLNINSNANTAVLGFYNTAAYENTLNPYSQKLYEASPLDKVLKQAAPGEVWKMTSGHEIKFDYQTNAENEVKKYKATATWNATKGLFDISFSDAGYYYAINELYKTITKDENWVSGNNNTTQEFKNKEGKVILKRTFNSGTAHDTFYVYDQLGNLTYVIPPAVSGTITQTVLDNMCYQYKYDYRNRLVEKKLPGKQWEYIVYDKLDRVVATGPAYNPYGSGTSGWLLTKYDVLNRPVYTAWYSAAVATTNDRKTLQDSYNNATAFSENKTTIATTINGISTKYTNAVSPSTFILLTVNYYDNYDYPSAPTIPATVEGQNTTTAVKGLATGSWVRVLDSSGSTTNELSYTIYDVRLRPIRSYIKNYAGGFTQVDSKLDWAGKTEYTITKHKRTATGIEIATIDSFEYSNQDRLIKHYQQVGSNAEQLITLNTYDELGQLISKKVGGEDITGANAFQNVDYAYNIRGWLKSINDVTDLTPTTTENDLFAFKINYNQLESSSGTTALFNGNIAETLWRSNADDVKRKYEYQYDNLNRLLQANYSKPGNSTNINNYKEWLSYDKNGNINDIIRSGNVDPSSGTVENIIDELHFTYDTNNKNLLVKVDDLSNSPQGFKDNYVAHGNDYTYDANGNMLADTNKDITETVYNHLNLPISIKIQGDINDGIISYIYNAVGQKVKKVVNDGTIITTEYLSGYQYENNILQFFPHAEGYIRAVGITDRRGTVSYYQYSYVFNYTDHLGNIRMSYALDPSSPNGLRILEENHYYPFGLKHQNYNVDRLDFDNFPETGVEIVPTDNPMYKYKYQGQERQDDLGLNWDSFKFRNYDYAIGRFMSIDPLAEKYTYNSTYAFQENKMGMGTELEGKEINPFPWLIADSVKNPNGVGAHTLGFGDGLENSVKGLWNAITNPVETTKGIGNTILAGVAGSAPGGMSNLNALAIDNALGTNSFGTMQSIQNSLENGANDLISGNGQQRGEVVGEIAGAFIGTKGVNLGVKSLSSVFSTPATGRVFWSGGDVPNGANIAKTAAADFASANGMKTLEMTPKGAVMNAVSPYLPRQLTSPIWASLSTNFAKGAKGSVNFFTTSSGPRASSIWSTTEKPILKANGVKIITKTAK